MPVGGLIACAVVVLSSPVVAANVAIPVAMLVIGLAVLVAGLVLLSPRKRGTADASPPEVDDEEPPLLACDWSAELESASGERITLRPAVGRDCCRYLFRLTEARSDSAELPTEERLFYSGGATQVGRDGAVTPLQREAITTTAVITPTAVDATMTIERTSGPSIGSPGWEQLPVQDNQERGRLDELARRAWELHLDQLHQQGARLAVGTASETATLSRHQRLLLTVTVIRGCDAEQPVIDVTGQSRVQWDMAQVAPTLHRADASLAAWVLADDLQAVAASPTSPLLGVRSWHLLDGHGQHGVSLVGDPAADQAMGEWSGVARVQVAKPELTIELGCGVAVEAAATHVETGLATLRGRAESLLELSVSAPSPTAARDVAADAKARGDASCTCANPSISLTLGIGDQADAETGDADSTTAGRMRLDDRVVRVSRSGRDGWNVVRVASDIAPTDDLGWEDPR